MVLSLFASGMAIGRGMIALGLLSGLVRLVLWLAALAQIMSTPKPESPWGRLGLAIGAAVVIDLGLLLLSAVPLLAILLFAEPFPFTLTAAVAIGGSLATTVLRRAYSGAPAATWVAPTAIAVLLLVGGTLIGVLFWQYLWVYFSIGGPGPGPTGAEIARYEVTAILCLASLAAAVVIAAVRRSKRLVAAGLVLSLVALGTAYLFSVPSHRWQVDRNPRYELPDDYVPCFGEGDPNCIGG